MNKQQFCWRVGAGALGVPSAVVFAVVMSSSRESSVLPWLGLSLVVFPLGGYVWGLVMWRWFRASGSA